MDVTIGAVVTEYILPNKIWTERSTSADTRGYRMTYVVIEKPLWITEISMIDHYDVYQQIKFKIEQNVSNSNRTGKVVLRQDISGKLLEINFTQESLAYHLTLSDDVDSEVLTYSVNAGPNGDSFKIPVCSYVIRNVVTMVKTDVPIRVVYKSGDPSLIDGLSYPTSSYQFVNHVGYITFNVNKNNTDERTATYEVIQSSSSKRSTITITQSASNVIFNVTYNGNNYTDLSLMFDNLNDTKTVTINSSDNGNYLNWDIASEKGNNANDDPESEEVIKIFDISRVGNSLTFKYITGTVLGSTVTLGLLQSVTGKTITITLNTHEPEFIFKDSEYPNETKDIDLKLDNQIGAFEMRTIESSSDKTSYIPWSLGASTESSYWDDIYPDGEGAPWIGMDPEPDYWPTWNQDQIRVTKLTDNSTLLIEALIKNTSIEDIINTVIITQNETDEELNYTVTQPNTDPVIPFTVSKVEYDSDNNNILVYFTTEATSVSSKAEMEYRHQESSSTGTKVNVTLGDLSYESTPGSNTWTKLVSSANKYDISVYNKNNLRATLPADFGTNTFVQISILLNKQGNKPTYLIAKLNK